MLPVKGALSFPGFMRTLELYLFIPGLISIPIHGRLYVLLTKQPAAVVGTHTHIRTGGSKCHKVLIRVKERTASGSG